MQINGDDERSLGSRPWQLQPPDEVGEARIGIERIEHRT
jgi:hypothetical protein